MISPFNDVVDSRDVVTALEELEDLLEKGGVDEETSIFMLHGEDYDSEYRELLNLRELVEDCSGAPDWQYGVTLIADRYFRTYAEELAVDIGAISSDYGWPLGHIDWDAAAEALKMDYFSVDWDGEEFWIRA